MKKLTKVIVLVLCIAMVGSMVACNSSSDNENGNKDKSTIAVLLPGPTGYFVATREGIDNAAKELGVNIEYADAQWDSVNNYLKQKIL